MPTLLQLLFPQRTPTRRNKPPHRPRDQYFQNLRAYYRPAPKKPTRKPHKSPLRTRLLLQLTFYISLALLLATRLTRNPAPIPHPPGHPPIHPSLVQHPVSAPPPPVPSNHHMRPPQFGAHTQSHPHTRPALAAMQALDDAMRAVSEDELQLDQNGVAEEDVADTLRRARRNWRLTGRDAVANRAHSFRSVEEKDRWTRTCYHSGRTSDALCVHVPFCVRFNAIVYMSDNLRCAPYSNRQGKLGVLGMGRCVELQREVETVGEIEQVEHKPRTWLDALDVDKKILWFEGDSVFVRMTARCKSVTHFAERIFLLHHVLQHPERYGMGAVSNVIIAADEDVARKIRYSKSWHHGLLAAIVYPNKIIYSPRVIRQLVTTQPNHPSEIRVFVPPGLWDLAKGRLVPCFRRAAVTAAVGTHFFLPEDLFPGVVDVDAIASPTRFHDADVFRTLLFQSLGHAGAPRVTKQLVYLHRAKTRTLTAAGLSALEAKLREVARQNGFTYRFLDVAGLTFPQQIEAVAGAGVVVGVHGTQMLNTLFLPAGAAIVEIFPYRFSNALFEGGSGAGLHYARHQVLHGEDFAELGKYHGLENCLRVSKECRFWYQSDRRKIDFGMLDAAAVGSFVQEAIVHVEQSL